MNKTAVFGSIVLLSVPQHLVSAENLVELQHQQEQGLQPASSGIASEADLCGEEERPQGPVLRYQLIHFLPSSPPELHRHSDKKLYALPSAKIVTGGVLALVGNPGFGAILFLTGVLTTGLNMALEKHRNIPASTPHLDTLRKKDCNSIKETILEIQERAAGKCKILFEWDTGQESKKDIRDYFTAELSIYGQRTIKSQPSERHSVCLEPSVPESRNLEVVISACQGDCPLGEGLCTDACRLEIQRITPPISEPQVTFGSAALSPCAQYLALGLSDGSVAILNSTTDKTNQEGWYWTKRYEDDHAPPLEVAQKHHEMIRTLHGWAVLTNKFLLSKPESREND